MSTVQACTRSDVDPAGRREASGVRRAVFLDRDGVINRAVVRDGKPFPPVSVGHLEILPGVAEALALLRQAGFYRIIVTNQPDVASGLQRRETVEEIHRLLCGKLPIDAIKVCYHTAEDSCECRKPKPGMLFEAAREWSLTLSQSYMIGDRWRDIGAGRAAGCKTILLRADYAERAEEHPDVVVNSLLEATTLIVSAQL